MAQLCDTLRSGVETVARSSVEALRQPGTITNIVRQIGLYSPVDRKGRESFKQMYGSEYRSATIKRGLVNNGGFAASPSELHGLWQIPQQLECALIYLSKFKIASHLTVGTYSGWTDVVIRSVLRRFNPRLRSVITDQGRFFHPCVGELIDSLRNVRFQQYASGNGSNHLTTTEGSVHGDFSQFGPRSYDFCFIDAAHSFLDTQADLQKAWSMCRIVMLHDIVQSSGVRPLWHATVSSLTKQRGSSSVRECLYQPHPNASLWSDWKRDRECTNALLKRSGPPPDARAAHTALPGYIRVALVQQAFTSWGLAYCDWTGVVTNSSKPVAFRENPSQRSRSARSSVSAGPPAHGGAEAARGGGRGALPATERGALLLYQIEGTEAMRGPRRPKRLVVASQAHRSRPAVA